jgi:predicted dehydrogenase
VIESGRKAQGRLSLAIGFQLRHAPPYVEIRERIRNGQIGEVICGLSHYYAGAIRRPDWPNASPQERRLRNWIHDRVLSGDIFVEQNIHLVDLNNWLLGARPISAHGTCGRRGRRDQGDCSSHYNVTFTYPNDVHVTVTSTQFIEGEWDVSVRLFGTEGNAELRYDAPVRITGRRPWDAPGIGKPEKTGAEAAVTGAFKGAIEDADAEKEKHWISSITSGNFINEAGQGAESTLSAILGRTAACTGRTLTFDEVMRSGERWDAGLDVRKL